MTRHLVGWLAVWCLATAPAAFAQPAPSNGGEPLQLGALQREARAADARTREIDLLEKQTDLRLHIIDAERLPSITALGSTQIQSDVPKSPFNLPGGDRRLPRRSSPTTRRFEWISVCTTRPLIRVAISRKPISPSRRRACERRCSRCARK
jgi:hypothetical protein